MTVDLAPGILRSLVWLALLLLSVPGANASAAECPPVADASSVRARVSAAEELARGRESAGDLRGALEAYRSALAAAHPLDCGAGVETGTVLVRVGWTEYRLAELDEAEKHLRTAAALLRTGPASPVEVGTALDDLGVVLRDLGRYEAAERTFAEALETVQGRTGAAEDELRAAIHNNLGGLRYYRGDYREALDAYRTALALFQARRSDVDVAKVLNNMGLIQLEMGDPRAAREDLLRALQLKESLFGPDDPATASTVENLAAAHDGLREWQQAGALHSRAATIYRKKLGPRHPKLGQVFQAWGVSRQNAGDVAGARPLFEAALAIYERTYGPDSQWVSEPLGSLALVHAAQGDLPGARQRASRVMGLALASGEKEQLWNSWADGAQVLARSKQLPAAVFFAKRAVNLVQQMREEVADLGRPLQRSFFKRREAVYRDLLGWLVALGRLTEAEEVLTMLKEEEYFDFVRESLRSGDGGAARVSTSAREAEVGVGYEQASQRLIAAGRRMREATEAGPAAPREELRQQIDAHPLEVEQVIRGLSTRRGAEIAEPTAGGTLPAGTAELRYVVGESGLRILVRTGLGRRAFRVQMGAARLNERIFALRQALLDPRRDPRPAARSLHDVLLRPAEPELRRAGVQRLELTLDGTLGLIPFAALHDGDRYLIERYAVAVHTLAAPGPGTPIAGADRLAAFGTSQALAGLAPLPRVTSELRHIVRTGGPSDEGILPGVLFLDREFTAERLRQTLAEGYPLVHIASHFIFRPGPLDRSFLVLGDGGRLTLEQLKRGELPMQGVRLLALSACSTAVGEGGDGRELESFATLAQRMGATAVLASLWEVADLSTSVLMSRFYRSRQETGRDDALAIARAQRSFLEPATRETWGHPFYWAPFLILAAR